MISRDNTAMATTRRTALTSLAAPLLMQAQNTPAPPNILFDPVRRSQRSLSRQLRRRNWMSTPNSRPVRARGHAVRARVHRRAAMRAVADGADDRPLARGRAHGPLQLAAAAGHPHRARSAAHQGYYTGVCGRYFHLDGVISPAAVTAQVYEKHQMRTWKKRVDFMDISSQGTDAAALRRVPRQEARGQPWFFWINYSDPHHPWDADAGKVDPAKIKLPAHLPDLPGVRNDLARYCGEVERADRLLRPGDGRAAQTRRGSRIRWSSSWATTAWRSRTARGRSTIRG